MAYKSGRDRWLAQKAAQRKNTLPLSRQTPTSPSAPSGRTDFMTPTKQQLGARQSVMPRTGDPNNIPGVSPIKAPVRIAPGDQPGSDVFTGGGSRGGTDRTDFLTPSQRQLNNRADLFGGATGDRTTSPVTDLPEATMPGGMSGADGVSGLGGAPGADGGFGDRIGDVYSPYMDYLNEDLATKQKAYDEAQLGARGKLEDKYGQIQSDFDALYAPQFRRLGEDEGRQKETAMRYSGASGSARGSRSMEQQGLIEEKAAERNAALEAEKRMAIQAENMRAQGASGEEMSGILESLNNAKKNVDNITREQALLEEGLNAESMRISSEKEADFSQKMVDFYAQQGMVYNPYTGESAPSLEGAKLEGQIAKLASEVTENDAQAEKIYDAINNPKKSFKYFTDDVGQVTAVITDDRGNVESLALGAMAEGNMNMLGQLMGMSGMATGGASYGGGGGGGDSSGYKAVASTVAASPNMEIPTGDDPTEWSDYANRVIEANGGWENMTQADYNAFIADASKNEKAGEFSMSTSQYLNLQKGILADKKLAEENGVELKPGTTFGQNISMGLDNITGGGYGKLDNFMTNWKPEYDSGINTRDPYYAGRDGVDQYGRGALGVQPEPVAPNPQNVLDTGRDTLNYFKNLF